MRRKNFLEKISIIFLFIMLFLMVIVVPNMNTDMNVGKLIINEVMLVNNSTIEDKYGNFSDYIELYNGNDYDINLYGYYLTDSMKDTKKWQFPDVNIKANEYIIIFASGKDTMIEDELHTNFKLDSKGETVALSNSSGKVISKVYVKETFSDTSYGYNGKKYVYYYNGTPLMENTGDYSEEPIYEISNDYKLKITEFMTKNINVNKSYDGKFYSLIEIYNDDERDINLKGFYLSDKEDNITKYSLPDVTIKKNAYLVIYASGLDKYEKDEIHTNFKLNNEDGVIVLSSPNKSLIDKVEMYELDNNTSYGLYDDKWYIYSKTSFGTENTSNYLNGEVLKDVVVNEVSIYPKEAIELKNISNKDLNLKGYSISDKSGKTYFFKDQTLKKSGYIVLNSSTLGFSINNSNEIIYLYKDGSLIDTFNVGKLVGNISTGRNEKQEKVYYKNISLGSGNSNTSYSGFSETPKFSIEGGYVDANTKIELSTSDGSAIYYTLNGSFPNNKSLKYEKPIEIKKNTVIKAISYKDGMIESDIVSRTFIVGRSHDVAFVSISTNDSSLFGGSGLITNYTSNNERKVNFEFYESDGSFGTGFLADMKLSGMDSRREPQKSMSIYLRKKYGLNKVTYPFFNEMNYNTYSSILLRNAGEDPKNVRIMDGALTRILKGEMDIDMQEYRPVVVYLNGAYYGLFNLREKLNADYVESKFGLDKDNLDFIKYTTVLHGSNKDYNNLVSYIKSHNAANSDVYNYLKTKIDMQELINYWIVESFYGNTDLGNIRYWKDKNGKWRWMLYDLDWSLWNMGLDMGYPTKFGKTPAATYLGSSLVIVRNLYKNKEFKELYLTSLAKYLKTTFKPERMMKIVDELANEIENEMPYHIKRWGGSYPNLSSMNAWKNNLSSFKRSLTNRYNKAVNNLKNNFNLSNSEYTKYFGDLK